VELCYNFVVTAFFTWSAIVLDRIHCVHVYKLQGPLVLD